MSPGQFSNFGATDGPPHFMSKLDLYSLDRPIRATVVSRARLEIDRTVTILTENGSLQCRCSASRCK